MDMQDGPDDQVSYEIIIKRWVHSQPKARYAMFNMAFSLITMTLAISYVIINLVKPNYHTIFSWRYIYSWGVMILYYSNISIITSWERYVYCLFCNAMATLKPTNTRRIMLRCNTCGALVFANGILSQQRIQKL